MNDNGNISKRCLRKSKPLHEFPIQLLESETDDTWWQECWLKHQIFARYSNDTRPSNTYLALQTELEFNRMHVTSDSDDLGEQIFFYQETFWMPLSLIGIQFRDWSITTEFELLAPWCSTCKCIDQHGLKPMEETPSFILGSSISMQFSQILTESSITQIEKNSRNAPDSRSKIFNLEKTTSESKQLGQ